MFINEYLKTSNHCSTEIKLELFHFFSILEVAPVRSIMSEVNRIPTRDFVELGDEHHLGKTGSVGGKNFRLQLLEGKMTSSEIDNRINAFVATLSTHLEALIQSVRELTKRSFTSSTKPNDIKIVGSTFRHGDRCLYESVVRTTSPAPLQHTFPCRHHQILITSPKTQDDGSGGDSDNQIDQVMANITDLPRQLHTSQAKTKLLKTQVSVFEGQKEKYNDFENLLLKHITPFQNRLSEEKKLHFFFSQLRDAAAMSFGKH